MQTIKCWYVACLLFLWHSLSILIFEEQYEVIHRPEKLDPGDSESIHRLICLNLDDLHLNRTEIQLEQLREELLDFIQKRIPNADWSNSSEGKRIALHRSQTGDYLILNSRICFLFDPNESTELSNIFDFLRPQLTMFALKKSTFYSAQINHSDPIYQVVVLNKPYPYSECMQNVDSQSRFGCLNECFKRKFRLSRYFYDSNETGHIQLNDERNRTIEEHEKSCYNECKRDDCKLALQSSPTNFPLPQTFSLTFSPQVNWPTSFHSIS